jgi:MATE family multidrug resistance protein
MLKLAGPLSVAQLAQMAMGLVGTLAAGRLGVQALAAQALAATTFVLVLITAFGLMAGIDPHVARAVGQRNLPEAGRLWRQSLWLGLFAGAPFVALLWGAPAALLAMGQEPGLVSDTAAYLHVAAPGLIPAMWYASTRSFCSAVGHPRPVMVSAVLANVLNAWLAFWFVDLGWGLPGIAAASLLCRGAMALGLIAWVQLGRDYHEMRGAWSRGAWSRPTWAELRPQVASGLPLAIQYGLEVTGFVLITLWAGLLGTSVLAAHEVAMSIASAAFQVPFSLGTAAAMRVGIAVGARDRQGVARAGWTAFALAGVFAALSGVAMVATRHWMALQYLPKAEPAVLEMTAHFLLFAAAFQIADGLQAVGFGVLRGLDDTRVPMWFNVLGFAL